jgi:diguanylate cyclase (GGDEF)-like protein/PAS domain S-box-containing protein
VVLLALLLWALALAQPRAAVADVLLDIADPAHQRDIAASLIRLRPDQRSTALTASDLPPALPSPLALEAVGPGPVFNWALAGFTNSADEPREAVIVIPQQGFAGSGFMPLRLAGPRLFGAVLSGAGQLEALPVPGETAWLLSIPAKGTATVAFEVTDAGPLPVTLWQREDFDARKDYFSFFRGALLGVSVLLAAGLFALYGFRARALFPVAGAFALAAIGFMLFEAGHMPALLSGLPVTGLNHQVLRAVTEGLLAAFLVLLLGVLSELQRVNRVAGGLLLLAGGLAFAVPIYGIADPLFATVLARGLFAAAAVLGLGLLVVLWRLGEVKAETALLTWGAILLWTGLAAAAALAESPGPAMPAILLAGLAAVLVVMGFALAHHAFAQGYLSRHFFSDAGRHSLALAGSRAYVWDWQPDEGELFVSPEIGRVLGQPPGMFEAAAGEALLELMHPADRSAYLATVEEAAANGRLPIERQFRLADAEGGYRWFELRARSIPGHGARAARCIGAIIDITNAKLTEERLLDDAVHDVVTGLPNRALFLDRLERALEAARQPAQGAVLFVLLVDLDRFKLVNEALGHEAGDALLSVIGRRLRAETDAADSVARLPGDKFAILFHEMPGGQDVEAFAAELVKAVARPIRLDGEEFVLTASIGIARHRGEDQPAEQLLKQAAIALYEARRRGPQTVELFNPDMVDQRAELVILEAELRRALERNEIEVHYQPIARLADMNLAGFEALVRWRHPKLGLLAPESFIGLAEETGLIRDIGQIVLNEAGRQLGIWQRAYRGTEPAFVAVNLSSSQLIEPGLLEDVKQIINREGLLRGTFKIEVTESLVMQYPERAVQILERFRELGVGLACDDFGTGYSSLSSLRRLPFDTLKVDRSFLSPEGQEQRAALILDAIIAMGHALGLTIVAEGIENQEQVDRLGELGCDYGQGFFIGKPMAAKQVNDALAGLPYAYSSGRTAITWLWERSIKDPAPEAKLEPVTAKDLETPDAAPPPPPAQPAPVKPEVRRTRAAARPAEPPRPKEPERPKPAPPEEPEKAGAAAPQAVPAEAPAPAPVPRPEPVPPPPTPDAVEEVPPPAPRRRKKQRRMPVLDDPDG